MSLRESRIYENYLRPLLFKLDPEDAHDFFYASLPLVRLFAKAQSSRLNYQSERLKTTIASTHLANPVGLAAGFDKNGQSKDIAALFGFGYAEIGSITHLPSSGNPKPRLFRLPNEEALINYMGLNGDGAKVVAERMRRQKSQIPTAINIAKTNSAQITGDAAVKDIVGSFTHIKNLPLAYVAINVSCANTHEGCLQEARQLDAILKAIKEQNSNQLPIFIKLSPDSTDQFLEEIAAVGRVNQVRGYIQVNTSPARLGLAPAPAAIASSWPGSLSGVPLKARALEVLRKMYSLKEKEQQLIGLGGISSGDDAYEFIKAGASALQIYTALVYRGPTVVADINRQLDQLLARDGVTLTQAVGAEYEKTAKKILL